VNNVEQNDLSDASISHVQGDTFVNSFLGQCKRVYIYIYILLIFLPDDGSVWAETC